MATYIEGPGTLYTADQKSEIAAQLERLLENSHFSHSKRFPSFLRFIIQEELEGRGDQLKERTLGVEVFGRNAGYDTTSDPIVRVTAAEIRKRIAQYYQESNDSDELRISLPSGSYVPHFTWPASEALEAPPAAVFSVTGQPVESPEIPFGLFPEIMIAEDMTPAPAPRHSRSKIGLSLVSLVFLLIASWAWAARSLPSALDRFWAPVLDPADSVVVCFPRSQIDTITLRNAASPEETQHFQEQTSALMLDDLQPLVSIVGLLEARHQCPTLMGQDIATLTDLRRGPTIFLGAFDIAWTLRVTRGLRYRFGYDADMKHFWIEDTQSPARWQIDRGQQMATNIYRDYAISLPALSTQALVR
jgi:hypothetical protein